MIDRSRLFDGLAGVAGNALSALQTLREEIETIVKLRVDETLTRLNLVRQEELDAVREMAANARLEGMAAETRLAALEARLAALEARLAAGDAP